VLNATLVGRLGRDPETRTTQSGKSITSASVAYDTGWGERKATTWIKVEIWGNRGEKWAEYHQKGSTVIVHGSVKMDTYTGRDGVEKQSLVMEGRDWEFAGSLRVIGRAIGSSRGALAGMTEAARVVVGMIEGGGRSGRRILGVEAMG